MARKATKSSVYMPRISGTTWFNSPPLGPEDLKGKIVLVDFWTYSCINCLRTMPYLRQWWSRYKDRDFVIIGIHAPEFAFEKDPANVSRALEELGVEWPVVLDNDYVNWHNFANHYWPAKFLADRNGRMVYEHFGEGAYDKTEARIQELLMEGPSAEPLPPIEKLKEPSCFRATPELYCGYTRGILRNPGGFIYEREAGYEAPRHIRDDTIALDGKFMATREYVESRGDGATLLLSFKASEVNLVLDAAMDRAEAQVLLEGKVPGDTILGADANGGGHVVVTEPRMYNLLKSDRALSGVLSFKSTVGSYKAFAFTFSGCID